MYDQGYTNLKKSQDKDLICMTLASTIGSDTQTNHLNTETIPNVPIHLDRSALKVDRLGPGSQYYTAGLGLSCDFEQARPWA